MRTTFKYEDFLDFYYNGKWASELGLIKVNNGKRQDDEVLPASKDTTIDIPGNDGVYYVNSKYQQREFKIDFAYDGLTEADIKAIREWLAPQKECRLIFSERPYKYYMAKPKSAPKLSYIAFDANDGSRVYKGEGSVQFVCYYPWARSVAKNMKELNATLGMLYEVTSQQLEGSNLYTTNLDGTPSDATGVERVTKPEFNGYILNNWGQLPAPFIFVFTVNAARTGYWILKIDGSHEILVLDLSKFEAGHSYLIDTENHLIMGIKNLLTINGKITYDIEESNGNAVILNEAIVAGDFFDLPVDTGIKLSIDGAESAIYYSEQHFLYDWLYY